MRYYIYPYKQGSKSARALANALGGRVLRLRGGAYKPRTGDVVINWGHSSPERDIGASRLLNQPKAVAVASNKLTAFQVMEESGVPIPAFVSNKEDAAGHLAFPVVCRTKLTGHSGEGIVIADTVAELVSAPLYVKYIKKEDEYRVHVGRQEVLHGEEGTSIIAVQRKARRLETPDADVNWQVRNHDNGFVFVRGSVDPPQVVLDAASAALVASGLDFGAVDVIYNMKEGRAYVLEINTAPGLEGQTITDYAAFFSSIVGT